MGAPVDTGSAAAIPEGANLVLALGFLASGLALLLLLPLAIDEEPAWGLVLLPFVIATPTLWALIHEAIHGSLHGRRRWNELLGRALAILFGAPLHILRFGHLTHHRLYGLPAEHPRSAPRPLPRALAVPFHYARIGGGVYLVEVAAVPLAYLPRPLLLRIAEQALGRHAAGAMDNRRRIRGVLLAPDGLARTRRDGLLILALYAAGFSLYGAQAWMLIAALAGRALLVSFMDNIYHHRPDDMPPRTLDLRLPQWASTAILHANLHAVHHRQPGLPWAALPREKARRQDTPEAGFVSIAVQQLLRPTA